MADDYSQNTRIPFRLTIPQASTLEASFSQPGPYYLFHNPHYQHFNSPVAAPHFIPSASVGSTSTSFAPSTSSIESRETSPTEAGSTNKNRCPSWTDAETRFLLEIWRDSFPLSKRRNSGAWDSSTAFLKSKVCQASALTLNAKRELNICKMNIREL